MARPSRHINGRPYNEQIAPAQRRRIAVAVSLPSPHLYFLRGLTITSALAAASAKYDALETRAKAARPVNWLALVHATSYE
jgi:hypothetical protein